MNSKQYLNPEQCNELLSMGVDMSDASLIYIKCPMAGELTEPPQFNHNQYEDGDLYTYTPKDMIDKLPKEIKGYGINIFFDDDLWGVEYFGSSDHILHECYAEDLTDALFDMLKWVIRKHSTLLNMLTH